MRLSDCYEGIGLMDLFRYEIVKCQTEELLNSCLRHDVERSGGEADIIKLTNKCLKLLVKINSFMQEPKISSKGL
jgi:hypothetical protein